MHDHQVDELPECCRRPGEAVDPDSHSLITADHETLGVGIEFHVV